MLIARMFSLGGDHDFLFRHFSLNLKISWPYIHWNLEKNPLTIIAALYRVFPTSSENYQRTGERPYGGGFWYCPSFSFKGSEPSQKMAFS